MHMGLGVMVVYGVEKSLQHIKMVGEVHINIERKELMLKIFSSILMFSLLTKGCYNISDLKYDNNLIIGGYNRNDGCVDMDYVEEEFEKTVSETDTDEKKDIVYQNDRLNFTLVFPESWAGYYKVIDVSGGVGVNFYGKSFVGQGQPHFTNKGLSLFYILDENAINSGIWDSIRKIGSTSGKDYYFATATDMQLAPIAIFNDEIINEYIKLYGYELYGETQIPIIKQDWEKVQIMQEDIDSIVESFKATKDDEIKVYGH